MAPKEALADPATWRLLGRYGLEVALAVRPSNVEHVSLWAQRAAEHGVTAQLWPMIEDERGRWLSASNARAFSMFATEVKERAPGLGIALDLEPPFSMVRAALDGEPGARRALLALGGEAPDLSQGRSEIERLCRDLEGRRGGVMLAVVPMVLADGARLGAWGRIFGGPWGLAASTVNAMLYTTLMEGYSNGLVRRQDACALLASASEAMVRYFGSKAAVSLGAVSGGALGDEPVYVEPSALAEDVAIALGSGIRDLWLFDLGGVLSRNAPEVWLSAFTEEGRTSVSPRRTWRSRGLLFALGASGFVLSPGLRGLFRRAP